MALTYPGRIQPSRGARSPVLIGRGNELEELAGHVERAPSVALIVGEAGIGKTRLVQELLRDQRVPRRVLMGHCSPLQEPLPLEPIVQAIRTFPRQELSLDANPILGALRPLLPELADLLPPAADPSQDAREWRHQAFRALSDLLRGLGSCVLVLEDMHWADHNTVDFAQFLIGNCPDNVALVMTTRSDEVDFADVVERLRLAIGRATGISATTISLDALDETDVGAFVAAVLGVDAVSDEFARYLWERTSGIPFGLEEVIALLRDRLDLIESDQGWARRRLESLDVPEAIRDFVLERMRRLAPNGKTILQAAAVVAAPTSERLLALTADLSPDQARDGAAVAIGCGLLVETDTQNLQLRHSLAQQVIYEDLIGPQCRSLHSRAASALSEGGATNAAQLAHHYKMAGQSDQWVRWAETAADNALSLFDGVSAYRLLKEPLTRAELASDDRRRLALKLAEAALDGLLHADAIAVLRALLQDPAEHDERGELRIALARLLMQAGDASAAWEEMKRAVGTARGDLSFSQVAALTNLAMPCSVEDTVNDHLSWLDMATEAEAAMDDPLLNLIVRMQRAVVLMMVGDRQASQAVLDIPLRQKGDEGASREEKRRMVITCSNLANAALSVGRYAEARRFVDRATALSIELGFARLDSALEATRLLLDLEAGTWEGIDEAARALIARGGDIPHATVEAELVLGRCALARGRLDEAAELLTRVVEIATRAGSLPVATSAAADLVRLLRARGDVGEALEHAGRGMHLVADKGIWAWAGDIGPAAVEVLVELQRNDDAVDLVRRFQTGLDGRAAPAAAAGLLVCRALVASTSEGREEALELAAQAHEAWAAMPSPYRAAAAKELLGNLRFADGQDGGGDLLAALEGYGSLDATWDAARVKKALRGHGVAIPYPWRGGRRAYGDELSPREEQVVRLVSAGRTNQEIAEELFLSPRTVAHHVSSAMRKMGVTSRRALSVGTKMGNSGPLQQSPPPSP